MHVDHDLADCDRTTSEMRGPSSRIQVGGFSMKQECANTHTKHIKIRLK
jgi:hypothetical protein